MLIVDKNTSCAELFDFARKNGYKLDMRLFVGVDHVIVFNDSRNAVTIPFYDISVAQKEQIVQDIISGQ